MKNPVLQKRPKMEKGALKLQVAVFALVSASFANIYITQPVLPVLQQEFQVTPVEVSLTVSAVIFGIVVSSLFFGSLSDKMSIHPILLTGGICLTAGGVISALTHDFKILVAARFFQGLFIPAMTTSLSAWLARTLSGPRLSIVMGSYVSATVLGSLVGRLLGGFIHPPLHWRYALFSAAGFILLATIAALAALPHAKKRHGASPVSKNGLLPLLKRKDLALIYCCGAGSLLIFSPVFNFLPYRMEGPPFYFSTELTTLIYLVYVLGVFLGPVVGGFGNRFGDGLTLIVATIIEAGALLLLLIPSVAAVIMGLLGVCAGFFTIHALAVGMLNSKLSRNHGKANAIYMLAYYTGGWLGITGAGFAFERFGWQGVVFFVMCFLVIPLMTGLNERKAAGNGAVRKI